MSTLGQFNLTTKPGQQRYLINSSATLPNYLKCDGSIVSQSTYPELYQQIGLIQDGLNKWTATSTGAASAALSLVYGNELFVLAGNSGGLRTSTDATTWTLRTSGTTSAINALTYGNGIYVYAGAGGVLATSTDAITWTARTSGTTSAINALTYGNGIYVYAGTGGVLATSTDAITWTARTSGTATIIRSLFYHNELYLYGADTGVLRTSTDAITWTARTVDSSLGGGIYSLTYGNGIYLCGFQALNGRPAGIATSTDAITWTIRPESSVLGNLTIPRGLLYANNLYICGGTGGVLITSTDGITWNWLVSPTTGDINSLIYANNTYVFCAGTTIVAKTSPYSYNPVSDFALPTTSNIFKFASDSTKVPYTYIKAK